MCVCVCVKGVLVDASRLGFGILGFWVLVFQASGGFRV